MTMTIKVGDRIPEGTFMTMGENGLETVSSSDVFKGKTVVLFGVPGAFTPTCSEQHLPGFVAQADAIKGKGVATIACTSVNDPFVLRAWAKASGADDCITMLADDKADFARAIGVDVDLSAAGLGTRSHRYAMIVDDGVIKYFAIEDSTAAHEKATAEKLLASF
ncbi:peroxiredoxin [Hyphomicrobium sp.]|uniref:peroxiredoxin n=1 Tax=Hyphomicrobium sp. TaxID=82 RepID=UPI002FDEFDA3